MEETQRRSKSILPAEIAQYRWGSSEWAYEDGSSGYPPLDAFDLDGLRRQEAKTDEDFFFRFTLCRTMIQALAELDHEGFFGIAADRLNVTLLVTITDSEHQATIETVSAFQLNPEPVLRKYLHDIAIRSRLA